MSCLCVFPVLVESDQRFVLRTGKTIVEAVIAAGDRYAWPGDENNEDAEEEEDDEDDSDEA